MPLAGPSLLLALALLAPPDAATPSAPPAGEADGRTTPRTVTGRVGAFGARDRLLTVSGAAGDVALNVDRDTAIFLHDRTGTVRDLVPGARVRAAYGGDRRAYWIEVMPAAPAIAPELARGDRAGGPLVLPDPSATGADRGAAAPAASGTGSAAERPGPPAPEPNPGGTVPAQPTPGPEGPGTPGPTPQPAGPITGTGTGSAPAPGGAASPGGSAAPGPG